MSYTLYLGAIAAFIISWGIVVYLTPKLLLLSLRKKMIDTFDSRKIHTSIASRFGGFSFFPAIFLSVYLTISVITLYDGPVYSAYYMQRVNLAFCALFILYLVGVADDLLGVRYRQKFFFQIVCSLLVVSSKIWITSLHGFFGIWEISDGVGIALTVFLLVFITNSINLIDGIDGLASLLSIIALAVYAVLFFAKDPTPIEFIIAVAALGALLQFFYFNVFKVRRRYESKIFMGDAGTLVTGFLLGVLAVRSWTMELDGSHVSYAYMLAYTMLVVPCFDTIRVFFFRLKNRRPLFLPDNNHIHHLLMKAGCSQHGVLLVVALMVLFFLLVNLVLTGILNITWIVMIDILCMALFIKLINIIALKK
ncbi:MraY family glycosyltransferase [uncultured Alistipes sp.]|jgi:glycosyltransferase, group 4 family|uniref:MraY family glycosyltransferase n=1 Tax=uncultured Alistipes sp. TaxID=538949 RepID=UPI0025DB73D5|nr:MraY family glycosyltransferase [uncultured Alistipes sp.]